MTQTNNISFRQNVFNTVISTLHYEEPHTIRIQNITEDTDLDYDLDLQEWGIGFFLLALEKVTQLDLDVRTDSLYTIGDICDLVETRFKKADKRELMHKVFTAQILPSIDLKQQIITKKQENPIKQQKLTKNKEENMIELLKGYNHPVTPESVFYNVKQILLVQNNEKALNLTMDLKMVKDLKIFGNKLTSLISELESRYQLPIVSQAKAQRAKDLKEFCTICAADFNKGRLAVISGQEKTQNKR